MENEKIFVDINNRSERLNQPLPEEEKIDLASYLLVLVKYRKFIILNFIAICVVVAALSLLFSNWYTAKTTILPPEKQGLSLGLSSSLLSGLSSLAGGGMSLPLMATPSDVYASIAESRTVAEEVIKTEELLSYYKLKSMEKTIKEVWSHLSVSVGDEGMVAVAYEDKNPQKAASVANAFALKLDEVNRRTFTSKAKNSRIFIGQRLEDTKEDLAKAEEGLRSFQQKNKAIAIDEQTKAAIGAAAGLQAQLVMVELELNVLSKNVEDTPELRQLQMKRQELLKQLQKLEKGEKGSQAGVLNVPFDKVPDIALEYARLFRELKIQESIFELLTAEYEKAKIEESKDTPTIQILDRAVPPERKSKPKRSYMVAFAGGFSLLFSIFFVFFKEFLDRTREKSPQDYHRLQMVYATLSQDWKNFRRKLPFSRKSEG
jgi:uncharacterized protein involved in exopolysaccharide biosynthesis